MNSLRLNVLAAIFASLFLITNLVAKAEESKTVRFAKQFGIGYLPLTLMEDMKLVEKHAQRQDFPMSKWSGASFPVALRSMTP